jgi:hypothetical protein
LGGLHVLQKAPRFSVSGSQFFGHPVFSRFTSRLPGIPLLRSLLLCRLAELSL